MDLKEDVNKSFKEVSKNTNSGMNDKYTWT